MKKFLALLISLSMLLVCVPGVSLVASAEDAFLSLTIADFATESIDGATYYIIDSADKFRAAFDAQSSLVSGSLKSKNFKLTSPITISTGFVPGYSSAGYSGIFDGNGQTITLSIGTSSSYVSYTGTYKYCGLFGYTGSATIKNLTTDGNVYIQTATNGIAPLASYASGTTFIDCVNYTNVYAGGSFEKIGGIVGYAKNGTYTGCVNHGTISGGSYKRGGIAGATTGTLTTFNNCVNYGTFGTATNQGGILGVTGSTTVTFNNCANYADLEATGGACGAIIGGPTANEVQTINLNGCLNAGSLAGGALVGVATYKTNNSVINFTNCYNAVYANGGGDWPGSFVGRSNGSASTSTITITNCYDIAGTHRNFVNTPVKGTVSPVTTNVTATGCYALNQDNEQARAATAAFLKTIPEGWDTNVWELPSAGYPYIQLKDNKIDIENGNVDSIEESSVVASVAGGSNFVGDEALTGVKDAAGNVTDIAAGTKYAIVAARYAAMVGDYEYGILVKDKYFKAVRNSNGIFAVLVYDIDAGEYTYKPYVKVGEQYYYGAEGTFTIAE